MYRAWQTSWYAWKNATKTLLISCTQKLVCAGAVFYIGTTSRSCSCADLLVRISAVHESHGYLGPDLINMTRKLRRVDTEKGRFAAFHQHVTVYLLAIWKRSQPISSEGSMKCGIMHKCKDSCCKTALCIAELKEWSPLSHAELILWNLAQVSDSSGTFFFSLCPSMTHGQNPPMPVLLIPSCCRVYTVSVQLQSLKAGTVL